MAFVHWGRTRLLLVRANTDRRNDAAGFTSCCGLVSCSAPLRTRPLDHARGFTTGDLGVSPDRTLTGWLPSACRLVTSSQHEPPCCHGAQSPGRTPSSPGQGVAVLAASRTAVVNGRFSKGLLRRV